MVSFGTQRGIGLGWYANNCMCTEYAHLTDPVFLDKCLVGSVSALVEFNFTGIKVSGVCTVSPHGLFLFRNRIERGRDRIEE